MMASDPTHKVGCEDLAEELRIASLALDAALDSIIVHKLDGTLVLFNEAAADHYHVSREEFAALPPWGWTNYADPVVREARTRAICDAGFLSFRTNWLTPDGKTVWMEIHARCVESEGETLIVSVARDITEQVRFTEMLEHLAFHDSLTDLANRAAFDDELASAITEARRHRDRLGLAYLDLDDFKDVNDSLGHDAGDQVLIALAERLKQSVRANDTIARLGGDEFVILLPRLGEGEELDTLAERLVELIQQPVIALGHEVTVKVSIGMALFDIDADDARSFVVKSDLAMYAAKHARDRSWQLYTDDIAGTSSNRD